MPRAYIYRDPVGGAGRRALKFLLAVAAIAVIVSVLSGAAPGYPASPATGTGTAVPASHQ